ncbi:ABC transporter substrate-binding protein [Georgenia faecalis]|uniref:ABC transporter substrate-binding protein n=1 Tax=Georgenia faecalis TaxID=2483799 RepID=A0ABV9D6R3_9MICO|nr:ABC transporter substrate-binding protein [Georgenia faecalis]
MSRSLAPAAVAAAAVLTLAACSTTSTGGSDDHTSHDATTAASDAFPVTVEHAFGETTIEEQPERVATISWVNADVAIALGVAPVGMPAEEFGGTPELSTPWKDEALAELGAEVGSENGPTLYSEADGIAFEDIAELAPDVILAAYSGLTQEEYDRLSEIAPVVAYPEVAFGTPWQESTRLIGEALGLADEAEQLVEDTEAQIAEAAAEHPEIEGKSFIYANLDPANASVINLFTSLDNRSKFLESIGMVEAPVVTEAGGEAFYIEWSAERADELASDVLVAWVPSEEAVAQIEADPLLGQIPAIAAGAFVPSANDTLTIAVSAASPLSLPWALDEVLPDIAEAARAAEAGGDAGAEETDGR